MNTILIEAIGWISTATFLISILIPNRVRLHQLGVISAITTGFYAYQHGATAIWVKWVIALFFHAYMIWALGPGRRRWAARVFALRKKFR